MVACGHVSVSTRSSTAGGICTGSVVALVHPGDVAVTRYQPVTTFQPKWPALSVWSGLLRLSDDMIALPFGTTDHGPLDEVARSSVTVAPAIVWPAWSTTVPLGSM